jgi:hypothetical protein
MNKQAQENIKIQPHIDFQEEEKTSDSNLNILK